MITYRHLATLVISLVFLTAHQATADWFFSGLSLEDDFNSTPFPGWNPSATSPSVDFGDSYLSPKEEFSLFMMDFTQNLNGKNRLLDISFDVVPGEVFVLSPVVTLNGVSLLASSRPPITFHDRYGLQIPTYALDYNDLGDLLIRFEDETTGATFGLDNVVLDWSKVIPEPNSFVLAVMVVMAALMKHKHRVA